MWILSAFADEISPDLDEQLTELAVADIRHLELRGVWGKNVLALTDQELEQIRSRLVAHGVRVSSIASPIGKVAIGADVAASVAALHRAIDIARRFDAPFIRIFSFFIPPDERPERYRDQVVDGLGQFVRAVEGTGITLLHENERQIYGDIPERVLDLLTSVGSPSLRAVWDPANFIQCGVSRPFTTGFASLRSFIAYVHVKDAMGDSGQVVPAGEGDGQLWETLAALHQSAFAGFFSLEPHLATGDRFAGFSGPTRFHQAATAFKGLLREHAIEWD